MPRKRTDVPHVQVCVQLPEELVTQIDLVLFDPVRGKRKYGAMSELVEKLIRAFLQQVQAKKEGRTNNAEHGVDLGAGDGSGLQPEVGDGEATAGESASRIKTF